MITLTNRQEYDYFVERGFQPLILNPFVRLEHGLRVEIQRELFGHSILSKGNILKGNQRFYEWCWKHILTDGEHICQNCAAELFEYSADFISHVISRSNEPIMAHDPRNVNIFCRVCHGLWEDYRNRKKMNIYVFNSRLMITLKREYRIK